MHQKAELQNMRSKNWQNRKEKDKFIIIIRDFNILISTTDKTTRQSHQGWQNLTRPPTNRIEINIYKIIYSTTAKYTLFSFIHGMYAKINIILGQKTNLNKFTRVEITQSLFSNHSEIKVEIQKSEKSPNTWKLKQHISK